MKKKKCTACGEMKSMTKFHKNHLAPDGRKYICAMCCSKGYYSGIAKNGCEHCAFIRECKDQINERSFTPYCFVSSKYHEFYQKEYKREGVNYDDVQSVKEIYWKAEATRLRGLLKRVEWIGLPIEAEQTGCPICQQPKVTGHADDCDLAKELRDSRLAEEQKDE